MPDAAAPAAEPVAPQNDTPQGKAASTLREANGLLKLVSGLGPQQLNGVAFAILVVAVIGFLGWRIYSDDKSKQAEREANVANQSQLLRFMESQQEKTQQLNSMAVKEGQSFYSQETEKQRKYYAEQEKFRIGEGKVHMKEAMQKLDQLGASIDKLTNAVESFKKKMDLPE